MVTSGRSGQEKIDGLRAQSEDSYIFALHAAVPLLFTPELLYQLWNNFKHYKYSFDPGHDYKISHIAVSDLIVSGFCREVGHELYQIEKGVRDILLSDLDRVLGVKRKNTVAKFLEDYAWMEYGSVHRKNLRDVNLLTAQSILNPGEMERQIIERINLAKTDAEKIDYLLLHHNLLPVGFKSDLAEISGAVNGNLSPVLVEEEDSSVTGVLNVALPAELRRRIRTISKADVVKEFDRTNLLQVSVSNGDLFYCKYPILVGHFLHDGIVGAGAEGKIDSYCDNALSERQRLGLYPGELGTSDIFLNRSGEFKGAIVVGLGKPNDLTPYQLGRAVENGAVKYALSLDDLDNANYTGNSGKRVGISVLLVGTAYGELSVETSVRYIIEGVLSANDKIKDISQQTWRLIDRIEFVEHFSDKSIACRYALEKLAVEKPGIIEMPERDIRKMPGGSETVQTEDKSRWWYQIAIEISARNVLNFTLGDTGVEQFEMTVAPETVDATLKEMADKNTWNPELGKRLFELLIPNSLKDEINRLPNIVLSLDAASVKYPWELLYDFGTEALPLSCKKGMIRQLTGNYPAQIKTVISNRVLIVGDPDLHGFTSQLPGAALEARVISSLLANAGYETKVYIQSSSTEIVRALFETDYKIMHLSGHGMLTKDPGSSGLVIGKNIYLSAREIAQMSTVPELVFVNCNLSGAIFPGAENGFNGSLASQLIDYGVKALVVTNGFIDDAAAAYFAQVFYEDLLNGENFGEAIKEARLKTFIRYPSSNAWGAYQCYGDPFYGIVSQKDKKTKDESKALVGASRAKLVGELKYRNSFARCIILKGAALYESLEEESVLVFNTHVLSFDERSFIDEAEITFRSLDEGEVRYKLAGVIWSSPAAALDVTVAKFAIESLNALIKLTADVDHYPFAKDFKADEEDTIVKLFTNGEFNGLELLDYDDGHFHYKTTSDLGSSGSPLFNEDWELLGIHHSFDPKAGIGEGIRISAVTREIRKEFELRSERAKIARLDDSPGEMVGYKNDIYISYSRDSLTTQWIEQIFLPQLEQELSGMLTEGPKIFWDRFNLYPGDEFQATLRDNLIRSKVLLAIITPSYLRSAFAISEWLTFKERSRLSKSNVSIPVILVNDGFRNNSLVNDIQSVDFTSFNFTGPEFIESVLYVDFQVKVSEFAFELSSILKKVPALNEKWPVIEPSESEKLIASQTNETSIPSWGDRQEPDATKQVKKVIRIFISSAMELAKDREALRTLFEGDPSFEIFSMELFGSTSEYAALSYPNQVRECDVFLALFHTKLSAFVVEEYQIAAEQFRKSGKPFIYIFFKEASAESETMNRSDLNALNGFKEKLQSIGHLAPNYRNSDELGRFFLNEMLKLVKKNEEQKEVGNGDFYTEQMIRELVATAEDEGVIDVAVKTLLIFQTRTQHTWLATTNRNTYILLDDENTRARSRLIQMNFKKSKTLPLKTRDSNKSKGSVVKFAARDTWWYYSRKLFPTSKALTEAVQNLIDDTIGK